MSCKACAGEEGQTHTCQASGVPVTTIIHAENDIPEPFEIPHFNVEITFVVVALDEECVKAKIVDLVQDLLSDDDVEQAVFSIEART